MPSLSKSQARYSQFEPSVCEAWLKTPHKNPLSGKIINPYASQGLYKKLVKVCDKDPIGPRRASNRNDSKVTNNSVNNAAVWMPLSAAESLASVDGMVTYILARSISIDKPVEDVMDWNSKDLTPVLNARRAATAVANVYEAQHILEGGNPASTKRLAKALSWIARRLSSSSRDALLNSVDAKVMTDLKQYMETNAASTNTQNHKKRNNTNQ